MVKEHKEAYSILPLRDLVVFPHMIVPLFVGRKASVQALEEATDTKNNKILVLSQRDPNREEPKVNDLYKVGTLASVLQVLRLQDGTIKVLIEGMERVKVTRFISDDAVVRAEIRALPDTAYRAGNTEIAALMRSIVAQFQIYIKLNRKINVEVLNTLTHLTDPGKFCNTVSAHILGRIEKKQEILETTNIIKKLERILLLLDSEVELLNTETRIRSRVRSQIEENQKNYYLNEQLKAIHKELGEEDFKEEVNTLHAKFKKLKLTKEARERVEADLKKLKMMNPMSSESTVIRNYMDWILDLPWEKYSVGKRSIEDALSILERDHYGLDKIKERILEYIAVYLRTEELKGPILCLLGAPGVGKTSLARSIADATGRAFVKISLGGLRDEAEIKGHRRTYIGAMPGKIIQAMKKAKTSNPLILLDEIDKLGSDYRGDPSSALLEALDPEQNCRFNDHYLELDYDISKVMFVATANSTDIAHPLLDRMEVIRLSGYTTDEKLQIAQHYLIPKQFRAHGITSGDLEIKESGIVKLLNDYTREAGVRNLDREIAKISRKAVRKIMTTNVGGLVVSADNLQDYLGVPKYNTGYIEKNNLVGITTGLAYTEAGGDILAIEVLTMVGKGELRITGKLGD
ncbi:endopeptidase La, partial [Rickettsiales endosymbiont of Peranema trichophorum]|uniref:endopeptidase La n=1 Tax=Rickettsiales endosymbiont of Peranema trichophorum TaxID=2486577 RepID=UPI0010237E73